ncbi:MAG: hypothetical protein KFF73_03855 [Cyclobacteriaceae bacterium]|nr:hypothetical protein [Cyclobacteriaceae bacterium]
MFIKRIKPFFQGVIVNIVMIFGVMGLAAIMYGIKYDEPVLISGLIILLITAVSLTGYYGIQIDYQQKSYRQFLSLAGIKIGNWRSLPVMEKIVFSPRKHFMRRSFERMDIRHDIFMIKLVPAEYDPPIIVSIGLYDDLMLEADPLSKNLGIPVVEYTK